MRARVLLVNDDDDALFLQTRSVRRALPEAEIACLHDATSALAYCAKHHVDAIVTDNGMPLIDGLTFVRAVRAQHHRIPILMVTNSSHLEAAARQAGVTRYLPQARWNEVGAELSELLELAPAKARSCAP